MNRETLKRAPTMTDVAKLAGVSQSTVSLVINNVSTANIPEETRDRVWEAVKKLAYRPNVAAKILRTNRTHTIGFVTDQIATSPHAGKIIEGAQKIAWENGKLLLIVNTGNDAAMRNAAIEMMLDRQVEGIIFAAWYHQIVNVPPSLYKVPAVLLDCYSPDRSLPSVVPDEVQGGRLATETLLKRGHRRIGFINLQSYIPAALGRLEGYKQALQAYNLPFDPALVREGNSRPDQGYICTLELLRLPEPPTAIFCGTDRTAMGAYDALRDLGLSVPDDVAIVGFDNQELIAEYLRPPLTTVALPHSEMGEWAVRYLLEQAEQPEKGKPTQQLIECPLVERHSV